MQAAMSDDPTYFLDLDMCSQYGQDTKDLINIAMQKQKEPAFLLELMRNLLNPCMVEAMQTLLTKHPNAHIVIYTMKGEIMANHGVPSKLLKANEGYIPSDMTMEAFFEITTRANLDTRLAIQRIFIARQAIQIALGLAKAPELIITGIEKSVTRACESVLSPATNPAYAYLWDDNKFIQGHFHVFTVPEYLAVPEPLAAEIHSQLETMFPGRHLKQRTGFYDMAESDFNLILYLSSAPENCRCYDAANNLLYVNVALEPLMPWPLPE